MQSKSKSALEQIVRVAINVVASAALYLLLFDGSQFLSNLPKAAANIPQSFLIGYLVRRVFNKLG